MTTPRDDRAAAREGRRHQHLQLPHFGAGRADAIRSRSPSPSDPGRFQFPPLPPSPKQSAAEVENDQFRDALAYAPANNMADETVQALAAALQGMKVSSRKPDLPAFDSKNIDIWLKRVDNAYRRAGITDAKDKFAFIEPKFTVDADPRINEFLFGEGTAEEWAEFERYLRDRHGRTKSQQAAVILDGFQRDGKLPSEMFALVKEKIGAITIDEIVKEMVLRELPTDIRRTIHDKVKDMSGSDAVKLADQYFDKDGKPIHKPSPNPINVVADIHDHTAVVDEEDVNAVGGQFLRNNHRFRPQPAQRPPFRKNPSSSRPQNQHTPQNPRPPNPSNKPWNNQKRTHSGNPTVKPANLCHWHLNFGKDAYTCEEGCDKFQSHKAGKARAGRHT